MNYLKQKYVQVTLELTEDFLDLIENHWLCIWGFIFTFFLQMYSTWLSIQNENILKMSDGFFKSFLEVIRLSQPGQFIIYLDIDGLFTFFGTIFIAIMLIPQIKILYSTYKFKKMKPNFLIVKYFASFNYLTFIPLTQFFSCLFHRGTQSQIVLSFVGLPLILVNSLYIQYITRNHIFVDNNLSRKQYSQLYNLFVIVNFIGLIVYQSKENYNLSIIIFNLGMILLFFEYFWSFPLSNPYISSFYFKLLCVVESDTILMTVAFSQSWQLDNDFVFLYIVIKLLIWNLSGQIFEQHFMKNIILSQDNVDQQFLKYKRKKLIIEEKRIYGYLKQRKTNYIDVYSEYIFILSESSLRSQHDKMQLIYVITYHKRNCINLSCHCQSHKFHLFKNEKQTSLKKQNSNEIDENDNQSIIQSKINKFIEILLRENLRHRLYSMSVQQKEVVSLKLISFVSRVLDNPPKAYYDLKIFAALHKQPSFHFESLFSVISYAIQMQIIKKQSIYLAIEEVNVKGQNNQSSQQNITLENMMEQLNQQEIISAEIKLIINLKIQFWTSYLNGEIVKFVEVQDFLIQAILKLNETIKVYEQLLQTVHSQSIISARIIQLYHMVVTRDVKEIKKCEHNFEEMIRRDRGMPQELLTALKVLENDIVILISTLLNNKGKLINRKTPHMANFFHYNFESFDLIQNVKQLMPLFLSQIHDGLMENYTNRGYSTLIKSKERNVFIIDANRFIRPVNISFENIFEFKDDFNIIAALVKQKTEKQSIIFDITGRVQGASKQLYQSIKEKSDYIQQMDDHNNNEILTIDQFFNGLFIFMIIPNIITQINQFLVAQRKLMKDAHYTDFGELSIMKYLIQTGQKSIEINRYEKCELYVPQNLEFFKEQFKQNTENELNQYFEQKESLSPKQRSKNDNNENIVRFVKGFCMFDQENLLRIENFITNQMKTMQEQNFFKYYLKVNLNFTLLAQDKYTTRNHAFFTLHIIDKKIHENMFYHLKDIRLNLKVTDSQYKFPDELKIELKKSQFSKVSTPLLQHRSTKSTKEQSFVKHQNQLNPDISKENQLGSIQNIFNAEDDCESENYFDEDFTQKSSVLAQSEDQFQQKKIEIKNDEQIEDGGSIDQSSQKESVKLGGQFLKEIFSSKRFTKGENKFNLLNIGLVLVILSFHISQIITVNIFFNQQLQSQNILEIQLQIEMDYDQIISSQSLRSLVSYMKDPERKAKWENLSYNYFLNGQYKYNKIISDNRDFFCQLQTINSTGDVQGKLLDGNSNQTSDLYVGYYSMLEMISTSLEKSKSSNQVEKQQSNFLIQENYFEIHFLLDKNNVNILNSFVFIQQQFNDILIIVNAVFITVITIFIIGSIFASRDYNNYFEHLLKTITLVKIEQIYIEIKRLNSLITVLSDKYHLWISQNLFHMYFNQNTSSSNSTSKDNLRKQRDQINQIRYKTKYRTNSHMIIYFLFFFLILLCFSTIGGVLYYSLQKNLSLNQQNHEGQFAVKMNLSNFFHMFTLYMAQTLLSPGDPMLKNKEDLEVIHEEVSIFRRDLKEAQDQFSSTQMTNSILYNYLQSDLCTLKLTDEILQQNLQNLCANDFARAHLQLGMTNLQYQGNITYMVENLEVELLLWQYYSFTKPFIDNVMNELRVDMNQISQREKDSLIIFNIFGILFSIILSYIAYITKEYFKQKRKGNQLLLSLIPNEMLCLENTMNVLKKLQDL